MFVLRAFRSEHAVSTFRLAKLSSEFQNIKEEIERRRSAKTRDDGGAATQTKAAVGKPFTHCNSPRPQFLTVLTRTSAQPV